MRTLKDNAQRIINGYREVCMMTPHAPCRPETSSDNAVRLAVHFQTLDQLCADLRLFYLQRDDVQFEATVKRVAGYE